jgi:hypothetical protein
VVPDASAGGGEGRHSDGQAAQVATQAYPISTKDAVAAVAGKAEAGPARVPDVLRPGLGHHRLGELTRADVQAFLRGSCERRNRYGVKITASTVQRIRATCRPVGSPARVYRWHDAAWSDTPTIVRDNLTTQELDLTYGEGDDHAEGISMLGDDRVLVVYDRPARARLTDDGAVIADVLLLPPR